ncbi:MAG: hypothetical protein ACK41W_07825 [Cyanobacteriota bacterium]
MEARHPHTKVAALIRLGRGNGFPVDGQPEMPGPGGAGREITQEVEVCVFHINGRERDGAGFAADRVLLDHLATDALKEKEFWIDPPLHSFAEVSDRLADKLLSLQTCHPGQTFGLRRFERKTIWSQLIVEVGVHWNLKEDGNFACCDIPQNGIFRTHQQMTLVEHSKKEIGISIEEKLLKVVLIEFHAEGTILRGDGTANQVIQDEVFVPGLDA